jgi:hypothetical protein
MPLLKLWNAIWGSAGEQPALEQATADPENRKESSSKTASPSRRETSKRKSKGFGLFVSNPHSGLCKLAAATGARSVLEIGVGDGSRAVAVMEALTKGGSSVRYCGIDQFELAGTVSLKDFHRTLRAAGIHPQLFPETVSRGLVRFLHTVGQADLVLLSDGPTILDDPLSGSLLSRVAAPSTTILCLQHDSWAPLARLSDGQRRAA